MFQIQDKDRDQYMLTGSFARQGYDWWWHSFTAMKRSTGEEKAFFIEYYLCNPALGQDEPVLGQLQCNQDANVKPSYLMVKAGCWGNDAKQLHRFIGWKDVKIGKKNSFSVSALDCYASETVLRGSVSVSKEERIAHPEYMSDAGTMSWKLRVQKDLAFHVGYGASKLFREIKAFEMYWHAQGMKTQYKGEIILDGEIYDVIPEKSYGYADKNWGRNFTSPWVWLSSNCLVSRLTGEKLENSAFDVGGGRPKAFGIPLNRKLLGAFYYEGIEFEFNFSKFWMLPRTKFKFYEDDCYVYWKVWQENRTSLMKIEAKCKKSEMLFINYESPDGKKRYDRLWNGGTGVARIQLYEKTMAGLLLVDDIEATHLGCEAGEYARD